MFETTTRKPWSKLTSITSVLMPSITIYDEYSTYAQDPSVPSEVFDYRENKEYGRLIDTTQTYEVKEVPSASSCALICYFFRQSLDSSTKAYSANNVDPMGWIYGSSNNENQVGRQGRECPLSGAKNLNFQKRGAVFLCHRTR